jgi:zinc and cadmium transporter
MLLSPVCRLLVCAVTVCLWFSPGGNAALADDAPVPAGPVASAVQQAWPQFLLGLYCGLIVMGSLAGGWLPTKVRLTHERMQMVISFVGGLMLGIGVLHLLPHAIVETGSVDGTCAWVLAGILVMFLLIRAFHVHHHGEFELPDAAGRVVADSYQHRLEVDAAHDHDRDHDHDHDESPERVPECGHGPEHRHGHAHGHPPHRLSWFGIALGLGLHTLIDGLALGASVEADVGREGMFGLLGLGTFLAVLLHKPLDAVSITSLMGAAGWSTRWQHAVNIAFALLVPVGAGLFLLGVHHLGDGERQIVGAALAFSAGVFICIALGDLLPEMEFHKHSRVPLTLALLLGISLAWAITFLEPEHLHEHSPPAQPSGNQSPL